MNKNGCDKADNTAKSNSDFPIKERVPPNEAMSFISCSACCILHIIRLLKDDRRRRSLA